MKLATAVLIFGAGLVALTHHDAPVAVPSAARPVKHRPVTLRAARSMRRVRRLPAAPHRVHPRRQAVTPPAPAPALHDWQGVAQCESGGDWHHGFYGGVQFTQQSWAGMGGLAYAPRADLASEAAQITVAERLLAVQGPGAWPRCGVYIRSAS